jgi:hypothetical protein
MRIIAGSRPIDSRPHCRPNGRALCQIEPIGIEPIGPEQWNDAPDCFQEEGISLIPSIPNGSRSRRIPDIDKGLGV